MHSRLWESCFGDCAFATRLFRWDCTRCIARHPSAVSIDSASSSERVLIGISFDCDKSRVADARHHRVTQKAGNSTDENSCTAEWRAPGELMMWWIAALLLVFLALDVVVKSTGASAKPPSPPASKS